MSMYTVVLRLTRKNEPGSSDDKIIVQHNVQYFNLFDVTYSTPELKMGRKFTADESSVMNFFTDILHSVEKDHDPFEHIQISTSIHPNFMYAVKEIDCSIRCNIINIIRFALRADVKQKRITSE
jgi:hypothetical protein